VGLTLAGLASPAAAQDAILEAAQQEFTVSCAVCHGVSGKGDGVLAPSLNVKPADLTVLSKNNGGEFPLFRVVQTIDGRAEIAAHGDRAMPVWGDRYTKGVSDAPVGSFRHEALVRSRILEVVYYIQTLQQK